MSLGRLAELRLHIHRRDLVPAGFRRHLVGKTLKMLVTVITNRLLDFGSLERLD